MDARPEKCWIVVASADHVGVGVAAGIMQVNHGKAAPLRRVRPGDRVVYYSPSARFRGGDKLRAFTAIGRVGEGEPYQVQISESFAPYRRAVAWAHAHPAPAAGLVETLDFAAGRANWAAPLRFGLCEIGGADMHRIAAAMGARV